MANYLIVMTWGDLFIAYPADNHTSWRRH